MLSLGEDRIDAAILDFSAASEASDCELDGGAVDGELLVTGATLLTAASSCLGAATLATGW